MKKYLLLLLPLLIGCTTTAERNVLNSLSAMGLVLDDKYEVVNISESTTDGGEARNFSITISDGDMQRLAADMRTKYDIEGSTLSYKEAMAEFRASVAGVAVANNTTSGYVLDMNDAGSIYSKVHIDTVNNKVDYKYFSKLY